MISRTDLRVRICQLNAVVDLPRPFRRNYKGVNQILANRNGWLSPDLVNEF